MKIEKDLNGDKLGKDLRLGICSQLRSEGNSDNFLIGISILIGGISNSYQ